MTTADSPDPLPPRTLGVALVMLALACTAVWVGDWDEPLLRALQSWQSPFWFAWTGLGDGVVAACLVLPLALRRRGLLAAVLPTALLCTVLTHLPKRALGLPRPPAVLDDIAVLGPALKNYAFPSGHTATAVGVCLMVWPHVARRWRPALLALATTLALSRVVCAVHWPRDVLAGAAIGVLSAQLGARWARSWPWVSSHLGRRVVAALVTIAGVEMLADGMHTRRRHDSAWWMVLAGLVVALPGLISLYRERDDRSAGEAT